MQHQLRYLTAILFCLTFAGAAMAGPNSGGVLGIHVGTQYYDSRSPALCSSEFDLINCEDARVNPDSEPRARVWFVVAMFPPGSRLTQITFGVDYDDDTTFIVATEPCSDWELATSIWPAPGGGTTLSWDVAQTDQIVKAYAFAGYEYYGTDTSFSLTPHPTEGGFFSDDSVPPVRDWIKDYGVLGFNNNPGHAPCPGESGPSGACCERNGFCVMKAPDSCAASSGIYFGSDTLCEPFTCPTVPCCYGNGICELRMEDDCFNEGGFSGIGGSCEPDPCEESCTPLLVDYSDLDSAPGTNADVPNSAPAASGQLGANAGGMLILHHNALVGSGDEICGEFGIEDCTDAVTSAEPEVPIVVQVLAVFPDGSSPSLTELYFGIENDSCFHITGHRSCATIEISEANWPDSGTGNRLAWGTPQTGQIIPIYWFAAYSNTEVAHLRLTPHPEFGGFFRDDSLVFDPIEAYGVFGFFASGFAPCPGSEFIEGACCQSSRCFILPEAVCLGMDGTFLGDGSTCDPDECDTSDVPQLPSSTTVNWMGLPTPNPTSNGFELALNLPEAKSIRIRLVGADGRLVATIANRELEAGPHRIDWRPETRISNGRYFVVLESSGWKEVRSVVIAR